ncbi:MAG: ROK family protein [Saprospiraceae bacterium]
MDDGSLVLGVDIGGTGIKGALIDIEKGTFETERFRLDTPQPSTPEAVAETLKKVIEHFNWTGMVGIGFPAIVRHDVAHSAANIHKDWKGLHLTEFFNQHIDLPLTVINDADAAGIAAMKFGAGKNHKGVVVFLTIGTGIGSALFLDGKLIPNSEFGHLYFKKKIAEKFISKQARKSDIEAEEWGKNWNKYLKYLERIISPDLVILGGGGGKRFDEIKPYLTVEMEVIPSELQNNAGIIGAALYAKETLSQVKADTPS